MPRRKQKHIHTSVGEHANQPRRIGDGRGGRSIHRQEDRGHLLPQNKANRRYLDYPGHNHRECMCDACGVRHRGPSAVHSGHTHLIVSWRRTTKRKEGGILTPKHQVTPCCQEVCREPRGQPETAQANREAQGSTHDWDKQRGCARESQ